MENKERYPIYCNKCEVYGRAIVRLACWNCGTTEVQIKSPVIHGGSVVTWER